MCMKTLIHLKILKILIIILLLLPLELRMYTFLIYSTLLSFKITENFE